MAKNPVGYDLVIATVGSIIEKKWGAKSWLAHQIGVSRQLMDAFRRRGGFPEKYVPKICEVTGLEPDQVRSDIDFELKQYASKRRISVKEARQILLRIGVEQVKRSMKE